MWRSVVLVRADVSKVIFISILRVEAVSFDPEFGSDAFLRNVCSKKTHIVQYQGDVPYVHNSSGVGFCHSLNCPNEAVTVSMFVFQEMYEV
jgi:hypothetical protein